MHFGRIADAPEHQNLRLPPDPPRTDRLLDWIAKSKDAASSQLRIGAPVWADKEWVGILYPPKTKPTDYLSEYGKAFDAVEVNSTFYQLLDAKRITEWRDAVGEGFRFCPKVYRGITENLAAKTLDATLQRFGEAMRAFDTKLGLCFAQLPESVAPTSFDLVANFLAAWPKDLSLALEFRHPEWFRQHALIDRAVNLLYHFGITTVITDTIGRRDALHLSLTQPKVLIRFLGTNLHRSDRERLADWAQRLKQWQARGLQEAYVFAHQAQGDLIPETTWILLEQVRGQQIPRPEKTWQQSALRPLDFSSDSGARALPFE